MKKYIPFIILILISFVFFHKTILQFKVPFPGDILIADYFPFKYESFLGYNPGSYPNKAQYFDVIRQMYPWKVFAVQEIRAGRFPLWNPYNFSGMPLFANNQSSVLNPFNLLFYITSPPVAWSIFIFFQPLLASFFTYLYLKKIKLSDISSIIGSVAFSYSLYMSVFLEYGNFGYSILYLPLLLFAVENIFENKKSIFGPLIAVIVAIVAFSGHLQLFGGVVLFSVIYAIARFIISSRRNRASLVLIILFIILGVGIAIIQLLPTLELLVNSARVDHNIDVFQKDILIQIYQLILLIAPDSYGNPAVGNYLLTDSYPGNALYVGVVTLVFALFALFRFRKNFFVTLFSLFCLGILLIIVNNPLSQLIYSLHIPFLAASAPSNYIFLLSFSLAVLSAFGVEEWMRKFDKKIVVPILIVVFGLAVAFILNKLFHVELNNKQIILGIGILTVSLFGIGTLTLLKNKKLLFFLPIILVFDLFYYFIKFNPFVPAGIVFPKTEVTTFLASHTDTRVWGYSAANMQPNFQTYYNIYSPEGYDPLYPKWYGKFLYSAQNGKLLQTFSENTRSDALVMNGYGERDLRENKYRLRLLDNLGVGLILDRPESATSKYTFDEKRFVKIYDKNKFSVYKNLEAKKRAYLTTDYKTYSSDQDFEFKFYNSDSLLLENNPGINIQKGGSGDAEIVLTLPDKVIIKTKSNTNSLLVLLDTYYPGWEATIDGSESRILKANYAFRAVALSRGTHTVIFEYKPQSFYWGIIITIISSMGVFCTYLYVRRFLK